MQLDDKKALEQIVELDGVKIIDSSFVKSYLANGWKNMGFRAKCRNLGRERKLYNVLQKYSCQEITYPLEMQAEFSFLSRNLDILYRTLEEKMENGNKNYESEELQKRFKHVLNERANLEANILKIYTTENFLSDAKENLSYLPALISIGSYDNVRKPLDKRLVSKREHDLHDERIFAKAMAIAQKNPVYILTGDSDFIRMHTELYTDIEFLSEIYGFKIPEYPVQIIGRFKNTPLIISSPNEELIQLKKENLQTCAYV